MKKILLIAPLAVLFANCKTERNSSRSDVSGLSDSTTNSALAGSMNSTPLVSDSLGANNLYYSGVYNPNNYMQNPERYKTPNQLGKEGGWTYANDWRVNTNFLAEAAGQWQLAPTEEVASAWIADTSKPEDYAAYWTAEAVQARYAAKVAADSINNIAMLNSTDASVSATTGSGTTGSGTGTGAAGSSKASNKGSVTTGISSTGTTSSTSATGSTAATGSTTTGNNMSYASSASSTTGTQATMPKTRTGAGTSEDSYLTAVNGNKFMMPKVNLYIENGTFTGFTGCNNISGTITVNGSQLHFNEMTPATNIQCTGGFDQAAFLDRLRRVDSYEVTNNQLRLKQGSQVLFVFAKGNS